MNYKSLYSFGIILGVFCVLIITGLPSYARAAPSGSVFYYTIEGNNYRFLIHIGGLTDYQRISSARFVFDNSSKSTTLGYDISTYKDSSSSHGMSLYIQKRTDGVFYGGTLTAYLNDGSSVTVPIKELKTNTDAGGTNTGASYDNGTITISVPSNSQLVDPSAPIMTALSPFPAYKGSLISVNARNLNTILPTHVDISTDGITFSSLTYGNAHNIGPFQFTIPQSVAAGKYYIRLRYGNNVSGFGTVHGNYVPIEIKNDPPMVTSVNPNPAILGSSITVNGRDFTSTDNDVQLSNDGGKVFSSAGRFASGGSTITFTEDAEKFSAGNYLLRVVNVNGISDSIPFAITGCVNLVGNGPRKIVFVRGKNVADQKDFLKMAAEIKDNLLRFDPYMTHKNLLSFYADLIEYDDSKFPRINTGNISYPNLFNADPSVNVVKSSCANEMPEIDIFLFNDLLVEPAWTSLLGKTIFINMSYVSNVTGIVLAHELGHSIGGLRDEYMVSDQGNLSSPYMNCTLEPSSAYRDSDGIIYGSTRAKGCTYLKMAGSILPRYYYRPSQSGIMSKSELIPTIWSSSEDDKFSVIDCGYLVSGLKGEYVNRETASKYWPECMIMSDTLKEDIPAIIPVPKVNSVTIAKHSSQKIWPYPLALFDGLDFIDVLKQLAALGPASLSVSTGDVINISGSGFSDSNNILQLVKISDQTKRYAVYDISSSDTENISYAISPEIETGSYALKVGAENSGWTDVIATVNIKNIPIPYPHDLVAVPTHIGQIYLSWKNSTLPNQTAIKIERIDRSKNPQLKILPKSIFLPVGETSYIDTDITPSTLYSYKVNNYISDPKDPTTRIIMRTSYVNVTSLPNDQIKPASINQPIVVPALKVTQSSTSSPSLTPSPSPTYTPSYTSTPSYSQMPSSSPTYTPVSSPSPSYIPKSSSMPTVSSSPTPSPSSTSMPTPSVTSSPIPSISPSPAPETINNKDSFVATIWSAILKLFQR